MWHDYSGRTPQRVNGHDVAAVPLAPDETSAEAAASGSQPTSPSPHGHQAQAHEVQGFQTQGYQTQGYQAQGYQTQAHQAHAYQAQGSQAQGYQAQGSQAQGSQAQGSQAQEYQYSEHQQYPYQQPEYPTPEAPSSWQPPPVVDYATVRMLHRSVADELAEVLRGAGPAEKLDATALGEQLVARRVKAYVDSERLRGNLVTDSDEKALQDAVAAELVGLGRLKILLSDPQVENIHVLGHDRVRVERSDGSIVEAGPVADSDEELLQLLQTLARQGPGTERALTTAHPLLDRELVDGSRLAAADQVTPRPYAAIRRHRYVDITLDDLVELGGIDQLTRDFLAAAVDARANIMIAGPADAGKTTLIRALASRIPRHEAFVVLEESRELGLHTTGRHPWAMSFEAREGHGEQTSNGRPEGQITLDDLIAFALRMSAPRIIVGEVRSHEIVAMLKAMRSSLGSMCTIHTRSAAAVMDRIIELALSHGPGMSAELAQRMAAGSLDLIVYLTLRDERQRGGGKLRYVSNIVEVHDSFEAGHVVTTEVFGPGPDGRAIPRHLPERLRDQLAMAGYDARVLVPYIEARRGAWRTTLNRGTVSGGMA